MYRKCKKKSDLQLLGHWSYAIVVNGHVRLLFIPVLDSTGKSVLLSNTTYILNKRANNHDHST